jgi:protease PrsW
MSAEPAAAQGRKRDQNLFARYGCLASLALFMLVCLLCSSLLGVAYFAAAPGLFLLANILALLTAIPYGLLLLWLDRNEQEPVYLILTAVMWGAAVSTMVSMVFNESFAATAEGLTDNYMVAQFLTASISAPFIEELSKGVAVLFIFLLFRNEFDNVLDGVLYGALVGLGFATVENVLYYMQAGMEGGFGEMIGLTWVRGILGGIGTHAAFTGITGCGFGLVRVMRKGYARWLLVPAFWSLGMFAHFAWNTFCGFFIIDDSVGLMYLVEIPIAVAFLQMPFVLLLLMVVLFVWSHENKIILRYLTDEGDDILTEEQRKTMVPARRRVVAGLKRFFTAGPGRWWHRRKLDHELIELAFVKWHHHRDLETTWAADEDADVMRLRDRVRERRKKID